MITQTIETANNVLETREIIRTEIEAAKSDAMKTLDDIENSDQLNLQSLTNTLLKIDIKENDESDLFDYL